MELSRLANISNYPDYCHTERNDLYPAFGLAKIKEQSRLRRVRRSELQSAFVGAVNSIASQLEKPQKEGDWAIMGGIAQGIGGIGAGIGAAAQTQISNMEIRQKNQENAEKAKAMRSNAKEYIQSLNPDAMDRVTLTDAELDDLAWRRLGRLLPGYSFPWGAIRLSSRASWRSATGWTVP